MASIVFARRNRFAAAAALPLAVLALLASAPWAQAAESPGQARYEKERAVCVEGRSNQDRATCLKEAEAAHALAREGKLGDPAASDERRERNARARCKPLSGDDQLACLARVAGKGTTSGSVAAGGTLTTLVTRTPAKPASAPAAPATRP